MGKSQLPQITSNNSVGYRGYFPDKGEKYTSFKLADYSFSILAMLMNHPVIPEGGWRLVASRLTAKKRVSLIESHKKKILKKFCPQSVKEFNEDGNMKPDFEFKYWITKNRFVYISRDIYSSCKKVIPSLRTFRETMEPLFLYDPDQEKSFYLDIEKAIINEQKKIKNFKTDPIYLRLNHIREFYNLTDIEIHILEFLYFKEITAVIDEIYSNRKGNSILTVTKFLSYFLGFPLNKVRQALRGKGKLAKMGLVETEEDTVEINKGIQNYISGMGDDDLIENFLRKDDLKEVLSLSNFNHSPESLGIIKKLLRKGKGVNILFYGEPGVGKTSLARSLASSLGREIYFVNELDDKERECSAARKMSIRTANEILDPKKAFLVVDEADQILNTVNSWMRFGTVVDKSWINQFLTENKIPILWITNDHRNIEESTRRRFSYSIKFNKRSNDELKKVWMNQVKDLDVSIFDEKDIEDLVRKYNVSPGAIGLAAKDLNLSHKNIKKKTALEQLDLVLGAHEELIGNKKVSEMNELSPFYNLDHIESDVDLKSMIDAVKCFERDKDQFGKMVPNINILLGGNPGVGKTEFAKYLAYCLEKPLLLKRASDLLDMFVGGTEANIAEAFREATQKEAILLIDECDSLLQSRESATKSWEVTQVNEILTWMENHKTICIMATNWIDRCDEAMMRRFAFKAQLTSLKADGVLDFYQRILAPLGKGSLNTQELGTLKGLKDVTPGDLKSVYQRMVFQKGVSHQRLIEELKLEVSYKKSKNSSIKVGLLS